MKLLEFKKSILRILLAVFFFLLTLGQIQRFQLTSQIAVYLHEMLLVLMTLVFSADIFPLYKRLFQKMTGKKLTVLLLLFLLIQTIALNILHVDLTSVFYLLRLIMYAQLFFLVELALDMKVFSKKQIYALLVLVSVAIACFGFAQYLLFPDTRWLIAMGWDDHYYRLISTLFDPGFTGLIISIGLIVYVHVFSEMKKPLLNFVVSALCMLAILLTYSRATYLAIGIVLLFDLIKAKNKTLLFIILLFFAMIPVLPRPTGEGVRLERTASISSRITSNKAALESLSLSEVIWGRGIYRNIPASTRTLPDHAVTPDNSFVFIFVSVGIIGSILTVLCIYELRKTLTKEPIRSVLLLIFIHSQFNNSLFYIWTLAALAVMMGITQVKQKHATV